MEEIFMNALMGALGSSPVALVLVWRLKVADTRIKELTADHNKFVKFLAGMED